MENNNECLNGFTNDTFNDYFSESEDSLKKCGNCPYFTYDNGIVKCDKFN